MYRCAKVLLIGAEDEENLAIRSLWAFLKRKGCAARIAGFSQPADAASPPPPAGLRPGPHAASQVAGYGKRALTPRHKCGAVEIRGNQGRYPISSRK